MKLFLAILKTLTSFDVGYSASKEDLIPPEPVLTRYKKEAGLKAFVKKELFEAPKLPDERRSVGVSVRATRTLCVQLNTLHVRFHFYSFSSLIILILCTIQSAQLSRTIPL